MNLYDLSIPALRRGLDNMAACLAKGAEHLAANGLPESTLLEAKLAADMYAYPRQVQIATDTAKGAGARLSASEAPSYADTETTIAELQERLAKTNAYLASIDPASIVAEDAPIVMKLPSREIHFTGASYVQGFVLPNFYFHATVGYSIMRHIGVPLAKLDYIGGI